MKQKCLLARRRQLRLFHFRCAKMSLASLLLLSQKVCDFLDSLCFCAAVNDAAAQCAEQRSCENLLRRFSCNHYTTFAFYVSKMCDNIASKRLDACRMMIQQTQGARLCHARVRSTRTCNSMALCLLYQKYKPRIGLFHSGSINT